MRNGNARADAGVGGCVRGDWPGTDTTLAGGIPRGRKLATGVGGGGNASAAGHAGFGSCGVGHSDSGGGGVVMVEGACQQPASWPDVGLRLRDAVCADAIYQRVICGNRFGVVSLDSATGAENAPTSRPLSGGGHSLGTGSRNSIGAHHCAGERGHHESVHCGAPLAARPLAVLHPLCGRWADRLGSSRIGGRRAMTLVLDLVLRLAVWMLLAPLLPGIINKVKAWVAGRRGPPVLQLYYDLAKLWQKGVVLSTLASPGFVAGPAVTWVALMGAAMLMPLGPAGSALSFRGDVLLLIYLLALARFCTAWAAMETGSAFEGMGAAREVSYAVLTEAAIIAAVLSLSVQTGSVSLVTMLSPSAGAGAVLLAAGLFTVLLAENCRVPFDDPNTHLELTMIHEVMILDHSGPPLAVVLHGASVKLLLFAVLLIQAVLPMGDLSPLAAVGALAAGLLVVTVGVGLVESLLARFAFRRVPLLLTTAFLLCLFALLVAWKGGAK